MKDPKAPTVTDVVLQSGRLVANYGRQVIIEDTTGARVACRLHGRRLSAVCGDHVQWGYAQAGDSTGIVYSLQPRERTLARLSALGSSEPIVANLSQLVVVAAAMPAPDWFVVDRYLAGAEWSGLKAVVVFNKCELGLTLAADTELLRYQSMGYRIARTSTRSEPGHVALTALLADQISVLVGQSGTGKSSLLNALIPEAKAITQEISAATEEGRHTTTHAILHHLNTGGELIDSPGVRDYSPPVPELRHIASGFIDLLAHASDCKFQDCLHTHEPGCAVRVAVDDGRIRARRYDSFRHLLTLAREMHERFPVRRKGKESGRPRE
jgi:ribosome biogenesis GTPase